MKEKIGMASVALIYQIATLMITKSDVSYKEIFVVSYIKLFEVQTLILDI